MKKRSKGKESEVKGLGFTRTHVQILRRFHNHAPGDGAVQVELLMRGIEETERLSIVGGRKQRCVAYAGACGWVIELVVTMREGVVDWMESNV